MLFHAHPEQDRIACESLPLRVVDRALWTLKLTIYLRNRAYSLITKYKVV